MSNYFLNSAILERNLRYHSPALTISWTGLFMKTVPDHHVSHGIQWENKIYSRGSDLPNVQSAYLNTFPWIWVLVITVRNVQFPCWQNCFPFIVFIQNSLGKWFEYLTASLLHQCTILDWGTHFFFSFNLYFSLLSFVHDGEQEKSVLCKMPDARKVPHL